MFTILFSIFMYKRREKVKLFKMGMELVVVNKTPKYMCIIIMHRIFVNLIAPHSILHYIIIVKLLHKIKIIYNIYSVILHSLHGVIIDLAGLY